MAEQSGISWTDGTWSPWQGCTQISMGELGACKFCYARQLSEVRFKRVVFGGPGRGEGTRSITAESSWKKPLLWNREPWRLIGQERWDAGERPSVFPSMCDPFDKAVPVAWRRRFFELIRDTPNLTWLLLTKRPSMIERLSLQCMSRNFAPEWPMMDFPRNAALLATMVTQAELNRDMPHLMRAAARFKPAFVGVSMEPMMGPMVLPDDFLALGPRAQAITGGETDQGEGKARPSAPAWFRGIRDQCAAAGVRYEHKQNGEWLDYRELGASGWTFTREAGGWRYGRLDSGDWENTEPMLGGQEFPTLYPWPDSPENPCMVKVGKKLDPCTLDGVLHRARPAVTHA